VGAERAAAGSFWRHFMVPLAASSPSISARPVAANTVSPSTAMPPPTLVLRSSSPWVSVRHRLRPLAASKPDTMPSLSMA
jgi:hypothetical protein